MKLLSLEGSTTKRIRMNDFFLLSLFEGRETYVWFNIEAQTLIMYISGVYKINYSNKLNQSIDCLNHQLPPPQVITIVFKSLSIRRHVNSPPFKKKIVFPFFFFSCFNDEWDTERKIKRPSSGKIMRKILSC